jgi:thymidylate kinase
LLPPPDLTIYVDIAPETAARRKAHDRDRYERDLMMLARVRDSYRRMAQQPDWTLLDGELSKDAIAEQVMAAVLAKLPART